MQESPSKAPCPGHFEHSTLPDRRDQPPLGHCLRQCRLVLAGVLLATTLMAFLPEVLTSMARAFVFLTPVMQTRCDAGGIDVSTWLPTALFGILVLHAARTPKTPLGYRSLTHER